MQPGLALVGEVQIAIAGEHEVVQPFEALRRQQVGKRRDGTAFRVEHHDAVAVVGDEDAAVLVDLQPVRLAVVLGHQVDVAGGRHAEDPAVRHVGEVEMAVAVKGGALEIAVDADLGPGITAGHPAGPAAAPGEALGQHGCNLGLDHRRRVIGAHDVLSTLDWCR